MYLFLFKKLFKNPFCSLLSWTCYFPGQLHFSVSRTFLIYNPDFCDWLSKPSLLSWLISSFGVAYPLVVMWKRIFDRKNFFCDFIHLKISSMFCRLHWECFLWKKFSQRMFKGTDPVSPRSLFIWNFSPLLNILRSLSLVFSNFAMIYFSGSHF